MIHMLLPMKGKTSPYYVPVCSSNSFLHRRDIKRGKVAHVDCPYCKTTWEYIEANLQEQEDAWVVEYV